MRTRAGRIWWSSMTRAGLRLGFRLVPVSQPFPSKHFGFPTTAILGFGGPSIIQPLVVFMNTHATSNLVSLYRSISTATYGTIPKSIPQLVLSHEFPLKVSQLTSLEKRVTHSAGKVPRVKSRFGGDGSFTFRMVHLRSTLTREIHPFSQQGMSGHQLPTLRNGIPMIINQLNPTTPNHSKVRLVFLGQLLDQRKAPGLARLRPFPRDMDTSLDAVLVNQRTTNIVFDGFPTFHS